MIWDDHPPTWTPTPKEYYASGLLTGSGALDLFLRSPEAYREHMIAAARDVAMDRVVSAKRVSPAIVLGLAVDSMLTEADRFPNRFVVTNAKTVSHTDRHKMPHAMYAKARRMAAAVSRHPRAREIIERPSLRQMCHAWQVDGVWYRMRADWVSQTNARAVMIPDLKCWDVDVRNEWEVRRHAKRLGTYVQFALYGQGVEDLWGEFPIIPLIIVSSRSPHHVVVRYLYGEDLTAARTEVEEAQKGIAEAFRTGVFCDKVDEEIRAL